jgi:hypothetical protein
MTLGFRLEVDENGAPLGYNAASSGNSLLTFRDNLAFSSSRVKNPSSIIDPYRWDRMPGNVSRELPLLAALWPRRAQF